MLLVIVLLHLVFGVMSVMLGLAFFLKLRKRHGVISRVLTIIVGFVVLFIGAVEYVPVMLGSEYLGSMIDKLDYSSHELYQSSFDGVIFDMIIFVFFLYALPMFILLWSLSMFAKRTKTTSNSTLL